MTDYERRMYETVYKPAYAAWIQHYPFTLEGLPSEEWLPIPDYEGRYEESNYGRTKSFWHGKVKILTPHLSV